MHFHGGAAGDQFQQTCIKRRIQRLIQSCSGGSFQHPVRFTNEADFHGQPFDGLEASLQNRHRSVVTPHSVHGHPYTVAVVDLEFFAWDPALKASEGIHHGLQH